MDELTYIWNDACDYGSEDEIPDGIPPASDVRRRPRRTARP